jgi:hypothetical protein
MGDAYGTQVIDQYGNTAADLRLNPKTWTHQYYTVQQGDSWDSIARDVMGNERAFQVVGQANGWTTLHPGMRIFVPALHTATPTVTDELAAAFGMATSGQIHTAYGPTHPNAQATGMSFPTLNANTNKAWATFHSQGLADPLYNGNIPDSFVNALQSGKAFDTNKNLLDTRGFMGTGTSALGTTGSTPGTAGTGATVSQTQAARQAFRNADLATGLPGANNSMNAKVNRMENAQGVADNTKALDAAYKDQAKDYLTEPAAFRGNNNPNNTQRLMIPAIGGGSDTIGQRAPAQNGVPYGTNGQSISGQGGVGSSRRTSSNIAGPGVGQVQTGQDLGQTALENAGKFADYVKRTFETRFPSTVQSPLDRTSMSGQGTITTPAGNLFSSVLDNLQGGNHRITTYNPSTPAAAGTDATKNGETQAAIAAAKSTAANAEAAIAVGNTGALSVTELAALVSRWSGYSGMDWQAVRDAAPYYRPYYSSDYYQDYYGNNAGQRGGGKNSSINGNMPYAGTINFTG